MPPGSLTIAEPAATLRSLAAAPAAFLQPFTKETCHVPANDNCTFGSFGRRLTAGFASAFLR